MLSVHIRSSCPSQPLSGVAAREEKETLVAVRKRKGMTHRDKSLCHIEQVPQFRSPLIIPVVLKMHQAHRLHACVFGLVCLFLDCEKYVCTFVTWKTFKWCIAEECPLLLKNSPHRITITVWTQPHPHVKKGLGLLLNILNIFHFVR